jgi:hypothetical protein
MKQLLDSVTVGISDSFVENSNKTGTGNGEAKLYLGQADSADFIDFFGSRGFKLDSRIYKSDLIRFMEEIKPFYFNPPFEYRAGASLKNKWHERMKLVSELPNELNKFTLVDQDQIDPPRCYAKSDEPTYDFLRSLPLSNLSKLVIVKYVENNSYFFDFKLVMDIPQNFNPNNQSQAEEILTLIQFDNSVDVGREIERLRKERVGQEKFRANVLKDCGQTCPFTQIKDASLLIAGHIKPWAKSTPAEKLDAQNGFAFTPTYDKLFNDGYITFEDNGILIISPLLSKKTREALGIEEGSHVLIPIKGNKNERRRKYLEFHRSKVFRN